MRASATLDMHPESPLLHAPLQAAAFALTQSLNKTRRRIDLLVSLSIVVLLLGPNSPC